ncbi:hypothetical protein Poli38472_013947 [Pythium oligandrum]|uniref:valine--tRNA ligase n=1 Tax=Pythium oligandrum TaxID=41045 RepID=A0A8K1F9G3_PYTOL|nr:hypothetical protein Poli38472_013947 [Pythium oligandrum]|eukprot:TMW55185.1 hypothetical protein Poli38472_013947 [Pythium oligandrum]
MAMLLRAATARRALAARGWPRHARRFAQVVGAVELPSDIHKRVREQPLSATFDPAAVEHGWQEYWQRVIQEKRRALGDDAKTFSMVLPPPNVTGALHIGHALTITIQDALARWHHMRGFKVNWIPGLDHAGIATQSVVERKLLKEEGKSKYDLGRDAFIDRVWQWNEQYGGRIMDQIDVLGAVVNKDQSYFTLDEKRSEAVIEAFVQLHERGLVYRKRRMVNWCPILKTAISDIEVDAESLTGSTMKTLPGRSNPVEFGVMHRILYKVVDSDEYLHVDTTRPETIFGDVAVAVHPEDPRYQRFHGKHVVHPFSGKHIPIVTDDVLVNMELGTGVVKVTPAHDPKDYECGLRHDLSEPVVIDDNGKMCGDIDPDFIGLDRFDAREKVVDQLKEKELYVEKLDHATTLNVCSRSGDIIEPLLMPQWFVDCNEMAQRAVKNVRSGDLVIEPKTHERMWFHFLENIHDWCISRQLWWGHRIPAYRVQRKGTDGEDWIVARSLEEAREKAIQKYGADEGATVALEQDNDVLDTWFSSGLLPISVFGWPKENPSHSKEYPLSVMETGSDILFFWVARMAMFCEEFTGRIPFERVLLHPMVRDKAGRKMSKSLGNVIDPIHVINGITLEALLEGLKTGNVGAQEMKKAEKELKREFPKGITACGTDALRYSLASYLQQGRQINMDLQRVVSHRHFCNKIWNAVRYALPLLERPEGSVLDSTSRDIVQQKEKMGLADRWILSRLAHAVEEINKGMESNQLATSVASFQQFFVQELCDVYIEFSKPILYGNRVSASDFGSERDLQDRQLATQVALFTCLDASMRLLHPFAPFVTEELWQRIRTYDPLSNSPALDHSILSADYPEPANTAQWIDENAESSMALLLDVIHAIRSLKHTVKILAPGGVAQASESVVHLVCSSPVEAAVLSVGQRDVEGQCRVDIQIAQDTSSLSRGPVLSHSISRTCQVLVPVPEDPETPARVKSEIQRLEKRASKMKSTLEGLHQRISAPGYTDKVPEAVQAQDAARVTQLETDLQTTQHSLEVLELLQAQY